jgi:membrane protease YdiL (CAAX protease family)
MISVPELLLLIQIAGAAGLFWSCFCRLVKTDAETIREIRWAIWFESVAAALVIGAPFLPLLVPELYGEDLFRWQPYTTPKWIWVLLLLAATIMQLVTAKFWRRGPPSDFQRGAA